MHWMGLRFRLEIKKPESRVQLPLRRIRRHCRTYYEGASERERADRQFEQIHKIISTRSFDVVDLREILSAADYYQYDGHWTPAGHGKAAVALADFIRQSGGPPGYMN
jgi:hypothetical protein